MTQDNEQLTFTTSSGMTLQLRRVATRHVARILAKHPIPEPPTYTFTAAGGTTVTKTHDATTLETPDDHKDWNAYVKARNAALEAQQTELARFLIYQCVVDEPPPITQWSVDFDLWGLDSPDQADKVQYKVDWIESEVLSNPDDFAAFMAQIYRLGGVIKEDQARKFEEFFRATLERLATA